MAPAGKPHIEATSEQISQLRDELQQLATEGNPNVTRYKDLLTDSMLRRFITARNGDVEIAKNMIIKHLQWRIDDDIDTILTEDYSDLDVELELYWNGTDIMGHPVLVWRLGKHDITKTTPERQVRYFIYMLERGFKEFAPAEKFVCVLDTTDLSRRNVDLYMLKAAAPIIENNYPERQYATYVLPVGTFINWCWMVIGSFLDPGTVFKIRLVYDYDDESCKKQFSPEQLNRLSGEPDPNYINRNFSKKGILDDNKESSSTKKKKKKRVKKEADMSAKTTGGADESKNNKKNDDNLYPVDDVSELSSISSTTLLPESQVEKIRGELEKIEVADEKRKKKEKIRKMRIAEKTSIDSTEENNTIVDTSLTTTLDDTQKYEPSSSFPVLLPPTVEIKSDNNNNTKSSNDSLVSSFMESSFLVNHFNLMSNLAQAATKQQRKMIMAPTNSNVTRKGILYKKIENHLWSNTWHPRYFCFTWVKNDDPYLSYGSGRREKKEEKLISLRGATVSILPYDKNAKLYPFTVRTTATTPEAAILLANTIPAATSSLSAAAIAEVAVVKGERHNTTTTSKTLFLAAQTQDDAEEWASLLSRASLCEMIDATVEGIGESAGGVYSRSRAPTKITRMSSFMETHHNDDSSINSLASSLTERLGSFGQQATPLTPTKLHYRRTSTEYERVKTLELEVDLLREQLLTHMNLMLCKEELSKSICRQYIEILADNTMDNKNQNGGGGHVDISAELEEALIALGKQGGFSSSSPSSLFSDERSAAAQRKWSNVKKFAENNYYNKKKRSHVKEDAMDGLRKSYTQLCRKTKRYQMCLKFLAQEISDRDNSLKTQRQQILDLNELLASRYQQMKVSNIELEAKIIELELQRDNNKNNYSDDITTTFNSNTTKNNNVNNNGSSSNNNTSYTSSVLNRFIYTAAASAAEPTIPAYDRQLETALHLIPNISMPVENGVVVLNRMKCWVSTSRPAIEVVSSLAKAMKEILMSNNVVLQAEPPIQLVGETAIKTTPSMSLAELITKRAVYDDNRRELTNSFYFFEFSLDSAELQRVDTLNLTPKGKYTFASQVYGLLVHHAFLALGFYVTDTVSVMASTKIGYDVGGKIITVHQLQAWMAEYSSTALFNLDDGDVI